MLSREHVTSQVGTELCEYIKDVELYIYETLLFVHKTILASL